MCIIHKFMFIRILLFTSLKHNLFMCITFTSLKQNFYIHCTFCHLPHSKLIWALWIIFQIPHSNEVFIIHTLNFFPPHPNRTFMCITYKFLFTSLKQSFSAMRNSISWLCFSINWLTRIFSSSLSLSSRCFNFSSRLRL